MFRFIVTGVFAVICLAGCDRPDSSASPRDTAGAGAAIPAAEPESRASDVSQNEIARDPLSIIVRSETGPLEFPRILRNFCEGEGCFFNVSVVACTTLVVRSADSSNAPEVGQIDAGDTVLVETGNVHVPVPGRAVMRRAHVAHYEAAMTAAGIELYDSLSLAAGDTLLLMEYRGEGYWAVGHDGRWAVVEEFWAGPATRISGRSEDALPAISIQAPEVIRWLRLRSRGGITGWWRHEESHTIRVDPEWPQHCPPKTSPTPAVPPARVR